MCVALYEMSCKNSMSMISESIFVGSLEDAYNDVLTCQVTHILNVAKELNLLERVNHVYKKIAVADDNMYTDIRSIFSECFDFIDTAVNEGGKVLIHCLEGKSRSVCVCLAYLCIKYNMSLPEALDLVRIKRPCIDIYPLYFDQLSSYIGCSGCD